MELLIAYFGTIVVAVVFLGWIARGRNADDDECAFGANRLQMPYRARILVAFGLGKLLTGIVQGRALVW